MTRSIQRAEWKAPARQVRVNTQPESSSNRVNCTGALQISEGVYENLCANRSRRLRSVHPEIDSERYTFLQREGVAMKGKGKLTTYLVDDAQHTNS